MHERYLLEPIPQDKGRAAKKQRSSGEGARHGRMMVPHGKTRTETEADKRAGNQDNRRPAVARPGEQILTMDKAFSVPPFIRVL
jgi:hypothetical protein